MSSRVQESIQAIVAIAEQYKETESLEDLSNPFEINFGTSTLLQEKFENVLKNLSSLRSGPAQDQSEMKIIKPKMVKMDSDKGNISDPGSLSFGFPDAPSINNSFNSQGEVLSAAKLVFKLKNDMLPKESSSNLNEEKPVAVTLSNLARLSSQGFKSLHQKLRNSRNQPASKCRSHQDDQPTTREDKRNNHLQLSSSAGSRDRKYTVLTKDIQR